MSGKLDIDAFEEYTVLEQEYEVEKIVDKKVSKGVTKYLVKWVGWGDADNTWEPIENLQNVLTLVEEFERNFI